MRVQDLMTKEVRTCRPHDNLAEPARAMWEGDCGVIPVIDESRRVVGMVTDRDICMAAYLQGKPVGAIPVASVMTKSVVSCRPDEDVAEAERKMQKAQVRRLPVVDADSRIVGVFSLNDLARRTTNHGDKARAVTTSEVATTLAAISAPRTARKPSAAPAATSREARFLAAGTQEGEC